MNLGSNYTSLLNYKCSDKSDKNFILRQIKKLEDHELLRHEACF